MAASMSSSSFQKKIKKKPNEISGTKLSIINSQLLVSTGVPSLDNVLGGGLAVGSVLLVEEDISGSFSKLLLKYFIAEGVVHGHELFISSADKNPEEFINFWCGTQKVTRTASPINFESKTEVHPPSEGKDDDLKIAWRYKNLTAQSQFGHYYDLSKSMDKEMLSGVKKTLHDGSSSSGEQFTSDSKMSHVYKKLTTAINSCLLDGNFSTSNQSPHTNLLRLALHSLGSPQWRHLLPGSPVDHSLCQFLYALRYLMRSSYAVCVLTIPTHLFEETPYLTKRIENLCDAVVKLDSFSGTKLEQNSAFKEYSGLFHVIKLARLNSLTCSSSEDTQDLAFKLRRKRFTIEKIHLPPLLTENTADDKSKELSSFETRSTAGCGSHAGKQKSLDF